VLHWVGTYVPPDRDDAFYASVVRSIQRYEIEYQDYSDIAYNVLVAPTGTVFEGRGWTVQSAANGAWTTWNRRGLAVCYLGGRNADGSLRSGLTDLGKRGLRWVWKFASGVYPTIHQVKTHSQVRLGGTECPGAEVTAFAPYVNTPPPKEDELPSVAEVIEGIEARLADRDSPLSRHVQWHVRDSIEDEFKQERSSSWQIKALVKRIAKAVGANAEF
jgi:hypothetical protein